MARSSIQEKVAALGDLSRSELVELWVKQYDCPPPSGVRQPLLVRAAASHIQEKQLGGLSANTKRLLKASLKRVSGKAEGGDCSDAASAVGIAGAESKTAGKQIDMSSNTAASTRLLPLPGARLIRDWNGRRYVVEVVDAGFVMDGKQYRSLTAIAFRITGARWSGPRFFGL